MVKVELKKVVSGIMWGYPDPKVGDVLEVSEAEAKDMIAGGWAEKTKASKKGSKK
jgi:hypothetical protein